MHTCSFCKQRFSFNNLVTDFMGLDIEVEVENDFRKAEEKMGGPVQRLIFCSEQCQKNYEAKQKEEEERLRIEELKKTPTGRNQLLKESFVQRQWFAAMGVLMIILFGVYFQDAFRIISMVIFSGIGLYYVYLQHLEFHSIKEPE